MKQKTLKRALWIAALALALLLWLTVIPGLVYEIEGPWDTRIKKDASEGVCHSFLIELPHHYLMYEWAWIGAGKNWLEPEGFSSRFGNIYFRFRRIQFSAGHRE